MKQHIRESLEDKVAIVTGGAGGIGKNIALALAARGAIVVVCDILESAQQSVESDFRDAGLVGSFLHIDLAQRGSPRDMVESVTQKHGRLDILVNNAKSGKRLAWHEEDDDSWDETMAVTLRAAFFASQAAIPLMAGTGGGMIVNIGSVAGLLVGHDSPSYHVAKAGVMQMTRHLATCAGPHGVRVNAVLPGFVVKDEHRSRYEGPDNSRYRDIAEMCHPLRRVGCSDDVAAAAAFLCSSESGFISGQCLTVDGGLLIQDQSTLAFEVERAVENR